MIKLLELNMSARIANMNEVKVLNKFPWGSKCDQTLTIERVCSGITINNYNQSPSFDQLCFRGQNVLKL